MSGIQHKELTHSVPACAQPLDRTLASEKKFDGAVDCTHEVSRLLRVLRRGGIVASITTLPSYGHIKRTCAHALFGSLARDSPAAAQHCSLRGDNLPKIAKGYHKPEFCCCLPRCIACLGFCGSCCKPGVCCDKKVRLDAGLASHRRTHL